MADIIKGDGFLMDENGQVMEVVDKHAREKVNELTEEKMDKSAIVQEAGQSESLIMSQKAVTDLVADAIGSGGGSKQYETVDSVEEMTDTSKQYVLSTTGTLWAYGEHGTQPAFTNLADPTDALWKEGYRISSSATTTGYVAELAGSVVTNIIDKVSVGDVIRIQGMDLTGNNAKVCMCLDKNDPKPTGDGVFTLSTANTCAHDIVCTSTGASFVSTKSGYWRFSGMLISSSADVIITANEEIKYVAGYAWYDTGMKPESTGGGDYVKLLVKVNENKVAIEYNSARLSALETGNGALTIPSFWQTAVDECISKIKTLQVGKNCVTFPFFSDNHQRNGYAGVLIAHIMRACSIPYAFFGGDTISSGYLNESEMVEQDKAFDDIMAYIPDGRFCRAVGNHDGFWNDNGTKGWYTRAQVYELFLRGEGLAQNKHYGGDGTYYYVDNIASRVRWIILNTNSEPISAGSESIDATQLAWMQDKALKVDADWGVVIISHCPISNHYHANVRNNAEVIEVINASGADVIGWFAGHIHRDRMYTNLTTNGTDGVEGDAGAALGFTEVTITSDNTGIAYDDATKHPVANDNQSHAIDFVTINKATRTVNLTRLGIGEDRSYTY